MHTMSLRQTVFIQGIIKFGPSQRSNDMSHRFRIGELVRISPGSPLRAQVGKEFKVLSRLPERDGELQYRVKNASEPFERVVAETSIEKV
jgi:hypothetical protein